MKKVLIVIPTYNEHENIDPLFEDIGKHLPNAHILVVDDNSQDGTADLVKSKQLSSPGKIHLLQRKGKLGLGTAYVAGFKWGLTQGYDILIEMDADLSHDAALLPKLVAALDTSAVAIGSRYIAGGGTENWSLLRLAISKFGSFYARTILGMKTRDLTGGFNAWTKGILERIKLDDIKSEGYSFQIELKYRAFYLGCIILELPFIFRERRAGQSKMSSGIVWEAMIRVWKLRAEVVKSLRP